jgi:hypothetical protein
VQECIHGLEIPLCDICYPKAVVEKPKVARVATPRTPRVAGVSTSRKSINVGEQRVYHVTHIRNLELILTSGAILPDSELFGEESHPIAVDLSTALTRELRRTVEVPAGRIADIDGSPVTVPGAAVSGYVPFFLSPTPTLWDDLRRGAGDETRWSAAARSAAFTDFVFLVTTVKALGSSTVIADGDAAGATTLFAAGESIGTMLQRLHGSDAALEAEALVPGSVPVEAIQLIGVANDRVRERVRDLTSTKVAVYPPWFQPVE